MEALPARGPGPRPDQDPAMAAGSSSAGSRAAARPSAPPATRWAPCATAHATKSCSSSPRTCIPQYRQDISEKLGDRGRAHHHARPRPARRQAPARRRRGLVHHPLRGALAARRQERGAARPERAGPRGRGRARRAGLHRILPGLPRLPPRRLAEGQPARLLGRPHRGGQRRTPHAAPAATSTSACASRAPRTISPAPSATA